MPNHCVSVAEGMIRDGLIAENASGIVCMTCGYNGGTFSKIQRHMEGKHSISPGYPCPMCTWVSKTKDDCQRHCRLKHGTSISYRGRKAGNSPKL